MNLSDRIHHWRRVRKAARNERYCLKHGHDDSSCWALTGAIGVKCRYCHRILWTSEYGKDLDPPRYQEPSLPSVKRWRL